MGSTLTANTTANPDNTNPITTTTTATATAARARATPLDPAQVKDILDTIRANLALVARTWGRESKQHREARGVMLSYLEENVLRQRHDRLLVDAQAEGGDGEGGAGGRREGAVGAGVDVDMGMHMDMDIMQRKMETETETEMELELGMEMDRGIEEVLAELRLS